MQVTDWRPAPAVDRERRRDILVRHVEQRETGQMAGRVLVGAFIAVHLVLMLVSSFPFEFHARSRVLAYVKPWLAGTGFWQRWDMFAPDPMRYNIDLDAVVRFATGPDEVWTFSRFREMSLGEKALRSRHSKWKTWVQGTVHSDAWPDVARYVARVAARADRRVREVVLRRHWGWIPKPVGGRWPPVTDPAIRNVHQELGTFPVAPVGIP